MDWIFTLKSTKKLYFAIYFYRASKNRILWPTIRANLVTPKIDIIKKQSDLIWRTSQFMRKEEEEKFCRCDHQLDKNFASDRCESNGAWRGIWMEHRVMKSVCPRVGVVSSPRWITNLIIPTPFFPPPPLLRCCCMRCIHLEERGNGMTFFFWGIEFESRRIYQFDPRWKNNGGKQTRWRFSCRRWRDSHSRTER